MIKYKEFTSCSFLLDDDPFTYDVEETAEIIHLFVKSRCHSCSCPACGVTCHKLYSTYIRTIQDTPIHGKQTLLHADVYKYYCLNLAFFYQVFTELLSFFRPSQVRTEALNTFILGVAIF
ncbi:transposase family protein [Enterococcus gilvus]|uniref:Transposase IS204/IS1001/IS1096/IS1165 zinc-finger domain-containing protein n=1 Tax=Enterococcus gilvus ATCC BAA-350 TaxID=1158614 RepID=R2XAL4_9ENTE|nr:transposase family protein [Enterococcus gilvus]EOI51889.1 hypothetical protein UKC_04106 [Enterococcus gilvus ATCC BAA-350]EOW78392.1 hypothetical protein I592_03985 [Enterococcus gilvus ATCC BAA-350]